jgi:hypothetical protein
MRKYKVIWFDDEHENFQPIKDEALLENVQLIGYSNAEAGIPQLINNYKEYDAVILDGLFYRTSEQAGTDIDQSAFGEVAKVLSDLKAQKKIIPWFVYSGQKSFVKDKNILVDILRDNSFANGKIFDKNKDEDFIELLNEIKKAADCNPERIIKVSNPFLFSIFENGLLSEEVESQLLYLLLNPLPNNKSELKAALTNIRSILESIYVKLEGINVLPKNLSISNKMKHLSGNKSRETNWNAISTIYQTNEIENLHKWIHITCGTYIHHLEEQHYDGYMISNYAVDSLRTGLMELLLWFKKTYTDNI